MDYAHSLSILNIAEFRIYLNGLNSVLTILRLSRYLYFKLENSKLVKRTSLLHNTAMHEYTA